MTYTIKFSFNMIYVSHINITIAHPNRTVAKMNQVRSSKITEDTISHDVLIVPSYQISLLYVHKLAKANKLVVCFNEKDRVI